MEKKICAKCKREKYLSDFNKSKGKKDGYKCYCRECTSKENRIYRLNNKDKVRNYYIENKEKYKDKKRLYDQKNKNKLNENKQRYVKNNPEKRKE